jgi:hypothetical protein
MTLVPTTKGPMDDSLLEYKGGSTDNTNEFTEWTEYWLDGEMIHRSVHVRLKRRPDEVEAQAGKF